MTEQNTQPSFIPKAQGSAEKRNYAYNLFAITGISIFVITLLCSGLLFGYKYYLEVKLAELEDNFKHPDEVFNPELKEKVSIADSSIRVSEKLLNNVKTSPTFVFEALEDLTTEDIYFNEFLYKSHLGTEESLSFVTLKATAPSFNAAAFQSDVFKDSDKIETVEVENIHLNEEGRVVLNFILGFSKEQLLYKENM
ncbi:MAG: hypothetical protein ACQEP6_02925 [Patescibacteria group bacterium]